MAQSRAKRNQRARRRPTTPPATTDPARRTRTRRVVIAFLILVGLAGILAVSAPGDDGSGAPAPSPSPTAVDRSAERSAEPGR
jgi:hypothetical protein